MQENTKTENSDKSQNKLFIKLKILTLIVLFASNFVYKIEYTNTAYRIGYALGSSLSLYIIFFCLIYIPLLLIKNKPLRKKASIISVLVLSMIYSVFLLGDYMAKQTEHKKINQEIMNTIPDEKKADLEKSGILEDKTMSEFIHLMMNIEASAFSDYMNSTELNGIIQPDNAGLLQSKDGLQKLYDDGQKIITQIDSLNIETDINALYSRINNEFKSTCADKYPYQIEQCAEFAEGFLRGRKKYISLSKEMFKRRINLVHTEYDVIKCLYEQFGTHNCNDLLNKYTQEETAFNKFMNTLQ